MSSDPASPLQVTFTPEFKRNLRQLAKKYRHIKSDMQPVIDQLTSGGKPGDQVPGVRYEVFKVRVKNSDASRGKSGGYRLIYFIKSETERVLVTIYSKTEQADIAPEEIRKIILDAEAGAVPDAAPEPQAKQDEEDAPADRPRDGGPPSATAPPA
jgi:mRNA-degrading endonuclease RelE of RelBE toxin-antitoxin system